MHDSPHSSNTRFPPLQYAPRRRGDAGLEDSWATSAHSDQPPGASRPFSERKSRRVNRTIILVLVTSSNLHTDLSPLASGWSCVRCWLQLADRLGNTERLLRCPGLTPALPPGLVEHRPQPITTRVPPVLRDVKTAPCHETTAAAVAKSRVLPLQEGIYSYPR